MDRTTAASAATERDLALSILLDTERVLLERRLALIELARRYADLRIISDADLATMLQEGPR